MNLCSLQKKISHWWMSNLSPFLVILNGFDKLLAEKLTQYFLQFTIATQQAIISHSGGSMLLVMNWHRSEMNDLLCFVEKSPCSFFAINPISSEVVGWLMIITISSEFRCRYYASIHHFRWFRQLWLASCPHQLTDQCSSKGMDYTIFQNDVQ